MDDGRKLSELWQYRARISYIQRMLDVGSEISEDDRDGNLIYAMSRLSRLKDFYEGHCLLIAQGRELYEGGFDERPHLEREQKALEQEFRLLKEFTRIREKIFDQWEALLYAKRPEIYLAKVVLERKLPGWDDGWEMHSEEER